MTHFVALSGFNWLDK